MRLLGQKIESVSSGRTTIDSNQRTTSFSSRAKAGDLSVVRKTCTVCNHHKMFSTLSNNNKCCKCGRES